MKFDDGDSFPIPDGREQDPWAPPGYTIPTRNNPGPGPDNPGTPPPTDPKQPPPPDPTKKDYPNIPNPRDYPAPALPNLVPPPPAFHAPDPLAPWTDQFKAPTAEEAASTPGFQFQLGEALKAIERSAAAKGTLLTGGTGKALEGRAVDLANTNYGDVYGRAYNEYDTGRQNFLTNEANRFNSQVSNEKNRYDTEFANWQGQYGQQAGLFGMADTNRMHDWGIGSDYFGMGQTDRMNSFNIWNTQDMNSFTKLLEYAKLKKPVSPYVPQ